MSLGGLSLLKEHKFKHGFNDTVNPICIWGGDIESINDFFLHCPEYYEAKQTFFYNTQSIDKMLLSQNESSLTHVVFIVTLNATPVLMHSFSTQQLNSYYLQEDSMDRYLTELFFLSLIHFWYGFLFVFVYLFCFLSLVCTYIPGVCNFLHLVLMAVSFVVIRFLFFLFS